jgi:hypothetical protein
MDKEFIKIGCKFIPEYINKRCAIEWTVLEVYPNGTFLAKNGYDLPKIFNKDLVHKWL